MTRKELVQISTDGEFALAMHVRSATWARDSAHDGARQYAREFGRDSRKYLREYICAVKFRNSK